MEVKVYGGITQDPTTNHSVKIFLRHGYRHTLNSCRTPMGPQKYYLTHCANFTLGWINTYIGTMIKIPKFFGQILSNLDTIVPLPFQQQTA